jgi:hypothetical protein
MSRQTMEYNPLDQLTTSQAKPEKQSKKQTPEPELKQKESQLKERMTVQIDASIIERVKDAVYWTPGLTVAQLTQEALEQALDKLEKKRGETFPKRNQELKPGRPIK